MKRILSILLVTVLFIAVSAGCGRSSEKVSKENASVNTATSNPTTTEQKEEKESKIAKISYTSWGSAEEKVTEYAIIKEFMDKNKDVELEIMFVDGNYEEKLQIMIAGQSIPDVISIGSAHIPSFAAAFKPLDEQVGAGANYISQTLKTSLRFDNKQYALPKRVNTKVFAYNKDLLTKAGVAFPGNKYTIEQFTADATAVSKLDKVYGSESLWFGQWLYQFGGKMIEDDGTIAFNSETGKKALQYCIDSIYKYKFVPPPNDDSQDKTLYGFVNGTVGFKGDFGPYFLPQMSQITSFDWDVCAQPGNGGEMEIVGVAMGSNTKEPEAAQRLIEFISTSKEAQEIIGSTSALPVTEDGKKVFLAQYPNKNLMAFFDAMSEQSVPSMIKGGNQIGGILYRNLFDRTQYGVIGKEDPAKVLDEAAKEAQQVIDDAK